MSASVNVLDHPATAAWQSVSGTQVVAERIDMLQADTKKRRWVWRMFLCGPEGRSIIAKRCKIPEARREYDVYQHILPSLPLLPVRCHGYLEDHLEQRLAWVFMEDVGSDEPYSSEDPEQRRLVGHWLGILHISGGQIPEKDRNLLRDRGPDHFRLYLDHSIGAIPSVRGNNNLSDSHRVLLNEILQQCYYVDAHWPELVQYCEQMPKGMVHGDFKDDHVSWHTSPNGRILRLIDWNEAGWGIPALDLFSFLGHSSDPDPNAYVLAVRRAWPVMNQEELYRMAVVGELFRVLASLRWEVDNLQYPWVTRPMATLGIYRDWLAQIIDLAPWSGERTLFQRRRATKSVMSKK